MRSYLLPLLGLLLLLSLSACQKDYYLTGYYGPAAFQQQCRWKEPVKQGWQPRRRDRPYLDSLRALPDSFSVVLFTGTWCNSSERMGSRFFALAPQLPIRDIQIISMDSTKRDSLGWVDTYGIDSIPYFFFERKGEVVGKFHKRKNKHLCRSIWYAVRPE